MKRKALCFISVVLLFSLLLNCFVLPVSSEQTILVGQSTVLNGGFEYPDLKSEDVNNTGWKSVSYEEYDLNWKTTATDKKIEYAWLRNTNVLADKSPHMKPTVEQEIVGKGPSDGFQFAEVVANEVSSLYQSLSLNSGEEYSWTVHHRGRSGVDTLAFIITDEDDSVGYVKPDKNKSDRFQQILKWMKGTSVTEPDAGNMAEYTVYTTKLKDSNSFETASSGSCFSFSKDSEHTEKFSIYLMSTANEDWGEYKGSYYSDASKNILFVLTPFSTSFTNSSGQISPSGGNLLDNMSFADKKGNNLLINAGFDDVLIYNNSYGSLTAANSPSNPRAGIGWCTTATDYNVEIGNIKYGDAYGLGASVQTVTKHEPSIREGNQFAELNANEESSLYQTVVTSPGKMYRWSLSHRGRSGLETMALIIGPQQQYDPKKTSKTDRDQLMQMVDWLYSQTDVALDIPATGCSNEIKLYTSKFNANGGFEYSDNSISWQSDENHTEEWSIWIISSLNDDWHDYGDIENGATYNYNYIVPKGQDTTVFGFVSVNAVDATGKKDKTYGNLLDNISFKEFYYVNADFNKSPIDEYGTVYILPEVDDSFEPDDDTKDTGWVLAGSNISVYYQPGNREFIGGYINDVFVPADQWAKVEVDGNTEYRYDFYNVNSSITVNIIYQAKNVIYDSCNQYKYQYDSDDENTGYEVPLNENFNEYTSHKPKADDGWKFISWQYILTHESDIKTYMFDAVHMVKFYKDANGEAFLSIYGDISSDTPDVSDIPESEGITFFAQWKYRQRVISKTFNKDTAQYEESTDGGTVEVELLYTDDNNPESAEDYIPDGESVPVGQELYSSAGDTYIRVTAKNKIGYIFSGWYEKDGTLVTRNPTYSYKVKDGGVTELFAYFEPMGFDVTVNTSVIGDSEDLSKYFAINCTFSNLRENHIYAISGLHNNINITVNGETVINPTNIITDEYGKANITLYMKHGDSATLLHLPANAVYSVTADNDTKSGFSVRGESVSEILSQEKTLDLYFYKVDQFVSFDFGKHYEGILSRQSPQEITITEKSSYTLDVETRYNPSIYTGLNISICFHSSDGTVKDFFTGTRILMIDMSDEQHPNYYSYTVNGSVSEIPLTDFTALGSTNNFTLSTGEMFTEKLVFIVDYVGTQNADSGKISLVYSDGNNELDGIITPVKKAVTIGEDTTQLTAAAVGNGNASSDGPFAISITVNESYPAVNTTYEGYQDSKYAVKLSLEGGTLPDGSYAVVGENKYYSHNGYIKILPLDAGSFNVNVYSPVPLELVDNKVPFKATLLSAVSTSVSVPVEKITPPIEFNCVEVAIDADVTDKVLNPGNVSKINVTLKHKGIDEAKLTISKKNSNGTYSDLLTDVNVGLPTDDNSCNVTIGSGFTAVSGETYIFSFVGYVGGLPVCKDNCCVVGGYLLNNN